ncbi:MAG TPA: PCYCGC motif-containing (lipo)protein [Gemmatimonadales bacterium]|nr:PCYCGC motif-containing (lipo)protein [Gemmatimonadales bacterium]
MTRRAMLGALARACAGLLIAGRASARVGGPRTTGPHPDPRPGIDASHFPPSEKVAGHPDAVPAYDEARGIPEVLDGIRCQCGCADQPGHRSLLSCYEDGMAMDCDICQGQARLAYRLHGKGQSLDQIRSAVDRRYGA